MTIRTARFQVYKAKDGWRWRLLSANNRTIATGQAHTRKADAYRAVKSVTKVAANIQIKKFFKLRLDEMGGEDGL